MKWYEDPIVWVTIVLTLGSVAIVLFVSFVALGLHTKPFRLDIRPGLVVALTIWLA